MIYSPLLVLVKEWVANSKTYLFLLADASPIKNLMYIDLFAKNSDFIPKMNDLSR